MEGLPVNKEPTLAERVRAKLNALKSTPPNSDMLGTGAAKQAGEKIETRKERLERAINEQTK